VDVAVLLDVAESMGLPWGADLTRAEAAREALSSFLAGGVGVGHVSVLTYARDARLVVPPTPQGALPAFDAPAPSGAARTGAALDAALTHLAAQGRPDRVQAILLLTDGAGDAKETHAAAARAARLGIPVHALVFAPEADPVLAEIAATTRGSMQVASLPLTLDFVHQHGSVAP
jgi:secreted protein with Ig-like and vWFA domain